MLPVDKKPLFSTSFMYFLNPYFLLLSLPCIFLHIAFLSSSLQRLSKCGEDYSLQGLGNLKSHMGSRKVESISIAV